ncbi:MAG: N-formylglutamate amidohydrolase [Acetobacteraceae bacterium]
MLAPNGRTSPSATATARPPTRPFTRWAADALTALGYRATVNTPYKGAELIVRHGDPARNRHSIQIEINRRLYMDEASRTPNAGFGALKQALDAFLRRRRSMSAPPEPKI